LGRKGSSDPSRALFDSIRNEDEELADPLAFFLPVLRTIPLEVVNKSFFFLAKIATKYKEGI
jgi:hypothetical protein